MTVYPPPRIRARRARPVVLVMLLFLVAAAALFSAASPHHQRHHTEAVAVAEPCPSHEHASRLVNEHDHDHDHGAGWTPRLNQRLRVADQAMSLATIVASPPSRACGVTAAATADALPEVVLSRLGVLRI